MPARAAASGFEAASRLQDNKGDGQSLEADDEVVHPVALSWNTECLARRSEMNVEAIFRYVDANEDGALFVHNPTLQMRARARAAVRVWDCGGGDRTKLCLGLSSPRRTRAGLHP